MPQVIHPPPSLVNLFAPFDLDAWLISSGRYNPLTILGGPGSGKSKLVGQGTAFADFMSGTPQVISDPTGGTIANFIDRLNRIGPDYERRWWEQYHQPLPPAWVHYVEYVLEQLASRLKYIDMSGEGSFPLYYRLAHDESLFDMSQRFLEIVRRIDPALETASVEGWNALYKIGTYAGMILSALGRQITDAEDLIRHPEQWSDRFDEALAAYPEVLPAVRFFREFTKAKPEIGARRSESFLTKILVFAADPKMATMFGASEQSVNAEQVVQRKQAVLQDYSKVHNRDRRRMLMLWGTSEIITYAKHRGPAGRARPLAIVIDEITQLLNHQQNGQSIMAADIEELVSVISRNYGIYLTIMGQGLTQVEKGIQNALLQGNVFLGAIANPDDRELLARYFYRFDPFLVKKETPVYMAISSDPFYDPVWAWEGNTKVQIDHVSTRTTPTVIDRTTEEFSKDDQLELFAQQIKDIPKYCFLVQASGIEGQRAGALQRLDIAPFVEGVEPDYEAIAEACRRLGARPLLPGKQTGAHISSPAPEGKSAPIQRELIGRMIEDHVTTPPIPNHAVSTPQSVTAGGNGFRPNGDDDFWEPIANDNEKD